MGGCVGACEGVGACVDVGVGACICGGAAVGV